MSFFFFFFEIDAPTTTIIKGNSENSLLFPFSYFRLSIASLLGSSSSPKEPLPIARRGGKKDPELEPRRRERRKVDDDGIDLEVEVEATIVD